MKPERVTAQIIGTGDAEVRVVVGVAPELFVAVRTASALCAWGWWPLLVMQGPREAVGAALCEALELSDEQQYRAGCPGAPVVAPPRTPR